jgi:hypothetical protein
MIRKTLGLMLVLSFVVLAGCGGGGSSSPPVFTGQILGDRAADGDMDSATGTFVPSTTSASPLYGLTPTTEFRAFLSFPLDGSAGGSIIPIDARVVSADLELHYNRVDLSRIPTLIDLVAYPVSGPTITHFNAPPLTPTAFGTFDVFGSDVGNFVRIPVTSLVQEAIAQGVNTIQFRLMYDWISTSPDGAAEFDDGPSATTAPLLTINYE